MWGVTSSSVLCPDNKDVSVMMSEMDVNAIAGTLKLYFRELPEPLFTDEFYPNFAEGIGERAWEHLPLPHSPLVRRAPSASVRGSAQTRRVPGAPRTEPVLEGLALSSVPLRPRPLRSRCLPGGGDGVAMAPPPP